MKKFILYTLFGLALALSLISGTQKSSGPPGCYAGEPPNFTNCTHCHRGAAVNSGQATLRLDLGGADTNYLPAATYTISIELEKLGMEAAGFQIIALENNRPNRSPGTIQLTEPQRTQLVNRNNPHAHGCTIGDKVWVEHTFNGLLADANGKIRWTYQWTAPDTPVGNISFYLAALEANYDLESTDDYTYIDSIQIRPSISTSNLQTQTNPELKLQPLPARNEIQIQTNVSDLISLQLYNLDGRIIKTITQPNILSDQIYILDLQDVPSGYYLLVLDRAQGQPLKKMIPVLK